MNPCRSLQLAVLALLDRATDFPNDWTVQGFGVLRLYVRNFGRIHIWDDRLRYPGVSMIHNHAWHLRSTVVCGRMVNQRYVVNDWKFLSWAMPYRHMKLQTGFDTKKLTDSKQVWMIPMLAETCLPGDVYIQHALEVHESKPSRGCVTILERNDTDVPGEADVYWPDGTEWGTATPRQATLEEVTRTVADAKAMLTRDLDTFAERQALPPRPDSVVSSSGDEYEDETTG